MDPADRKESLWPDRSGWILIGVLTLLQCWNLDRVELTVTDECRSAVIVRDMVEDGHWLLPRTPDGYLCEKPLAYYGMAAALGKLFGINEWTLRLVSVFMGMGTLVMTWILARLYGPPRLACIAVLALASNILFLISARCAMVDMTLAFFVTAGLTAHFAARLGRLSPLKGAVLAGIAFGLAILSKGPLGLALPIAVAGGDAILEHRGRFWRALTWWKPMLVTIGLALAVACAWYVPAALRGGREFVETSILSENFRMPVGDAQGIGVSHRKPLLYYLGVQLAVILPMLPLLPTLVGWASDRSSDPARRHLAAWLGFGFLLFQVAVNKRMYYLIPLQPAIAVMIALAAERALVQNSERTLKISALVAGLLFMVVGLVASFYNFQSPLITSIRAGTVSEAVSRHSAWLKGFGILLIVVGVNLARVRKATLQVGWSCALAFVVVLGSVGLVDRLEAEFNRTRPFIARAAPKVPPDKRPVIQPPIRGYSLDFYWPTRIVRDNDAVATAEYLLIGRRNLAKIGAAPGETIDLWKSNPDGRDDVLLLRRERPR